MPFFARPNLDNEQFKQLSGTTLTLEGTTQIASTRGLMLSGDTGYIPIVVTGATYGDVLTYSTDGTVKLMPSSGSGGTSMYLPPYKSPSTCTVGGLAEGTVLTGKTLSYILQQILVPTKPPVLTNPSSTFAITPPYSPYEVGSIINITASATFNRGCISPQYPPTASDKRSGCAYFYCYNVWGTPTGVASSLATNTFPISAHPVTYGNNTISSSVLYSAGTQPYNSSGGTYCAALPASATTSNSCTISGLFPYYYGKVTCAAAAGVGRPTLSCIKSMITGGTANKVIVCSNNTIGINFNSTSSDYLWFAIPVCGGAIKTKWCIDALNNGNIGGGVSAGGNLFPVADSLSGVCSPLWNNVGCSPQTYNVYTSNYQSTSTSIMYLKNS